MTMGAFNVAAANNTTNELVKKFPFPSAKQYLARGAYKCINELFRLSGSLPKAAFAKLRLATG